MDRLLTDEEIHHIATEIEYSNIGKSGGWLDTARAVAKASQVKTLKMMEEWLLAEDDMPLVDEYKYLPRTVAQVKAKLKEWG